MTAIDDQVGFHVLRFSRRWIVMRHAHGSLQLTRSSMSARLSGPVVKVGYPKSIYPEEASATTFGQAANSRETDGSGPGGCDQNEPHLRLMLAVLEDALNIIRDPARHVRAGRRRLVRETIDWVLSDDVSWPFSFLNVCEALSIDERRLRTRLSPWLEQPPSPFPERWVAVTAEPVEVDAVTIV